MMKRRSLISTLIIIPVLTLAQDRSIEAEKALTELLFNEEADEFTAYRFINARGYVEITFASNTPRDLAKELMAKIKSLPGISGARESFAGSPCRRF